MENKNSHLDLIRKQFTRTAELYARTRQATDERALEALVGLSGASSTDRCLDVACGPGFLTLAFARRCAEATGFDATDAFLGLTTAHHVRFTLDNDVDEWITHGASGEAARREIISLMESCLVDDRAGLTVRHEDGRLRFTHRVAVFVFERTNSPPNF